MGANASTAVPLYASGQVLDAARLNLTNCGVPVFSGTATRDAAFGGSGEKVLAEGQLCYLEDSNVVQYYDGASFATVGPTITTAPALVLISTTSFTNQATVDITAFSATYDNYKVITQTTAGTDDLFFRLGVGGSFNSTANNYRWNIQYATYTSSTITGGSSSTTATGFILGNAQGLASSIEVYNPFATAATGYTFLSTRQDYGFMAGGGAITVTTSYSQMRFYATSGNITGTISVYGYAK